jgi:hypothetical protein
MKRKIVLEFDEDGFSVRPDDNVTDMEILMVLCNALIKNGRLIHENHKCDDEECCAQLLGMELSAALYGAMNVHNITHNHNDHAEENI